MILINYIDTNIPQLLNDATISIHLDRFIIIVSTYSTPFKIVVVGGKTRLK